MSFQLDLFSSNLFLFCNRQRDKLKIRIKTGGVWRFYGKMNLNNMEGFTNMEGIIILVLFGLLLSFITVILFLILSVRIIISLIKKKPFPKILLLATLFGIGLV